MTKYAVGYHQVQEQEAKKKFRGDCLSLIGILIALFAFWYIVSLFI